MTLGQSVEHPDLSGRHRLLRGVAAALAQKVTSAITVLIALAAFNRVVDPESYGVISLYVTFQVALSVLDLGIGTSASREFARPMSAVEWALRFRAYEAWSRIVSLVVLFVGLATSQLIVTADATGLQRGTLAVAVLCLALELPSRLYLGVLLAEGHQATSAAMVAISDVVRWFGGVVVCAVTGTALSGLLWQFFVVLSLLSLLRHRLYGARKTPGARGAFPWHLLCSIGRMALLPLAAATVAGGGRLYADRLYASAVLPLSELGVYTTTFTSMGVLALLSTQLSSALVPRLSQQDAAGSWRRSLRLFSLASLTVGAVTTVGAVVILATMHDWIASLLGFNGERAELMHTLLPLAVTASVLAAVSGPAYSAVAAMGHFHGVAVANVIGLALAGAMLLAAPGSPAAIGSVAVLPSAVVAGLTAAMLWERGQGVRFGVQLIVTQVFLIGWLIAASMIVWGTR